MSEPITPHAALIYVMETMSAVDRKMTDEELATIGQLVTTLPVFASYDTSNLVQTAELCGELLSKESGLDGLMDQVQTALPAKLYETAYALAVEIAAVDLDVKDEEVRFLELLSDKLNLDKLQTSAIERGARARHAVL